MKNYIKIIVIAVISILVFTGCTSPDIIVKDTLSPVLITKSGTFVTETEYYSLIDGEAVKQRLKSKIGDYYLPENLITIKDGNVVLFKEK